MGKTAQQAGFPPDLAVGGLSTSPLGSGVAGDIWPRRDGTLHDATIPRDLQAGDQSPGGRSGPRGRSGPPSVGRWSRPTRSGWPRSPPLRGEALDLQLVLLSVPQHRHPAARRPVVLPRAVAAPHRGGPALGLRPGDPGTAIVVDADDVPDHRDGSGDEGALLEREVRPQGQQHGGAHAEPHRGEAGALLHETGARGSGARGAIGPKDYTATWVAASPGGGTPTARRSSRAPG